MSNSLNKTAHREMSYGSQLAFTSNARCYPCDGKAEPPDSHRSDPNGGNGRFGDGGPGFLHPLDLVRCAARALPAESRIKRGMEALTMTPNAAESPEAAHLRLLEALPEPALIFDPQGKVVAINAAGLELVEAEASDEVLGKCMLSMLSSA
jgi:PAS domain-containing protein